MVLDIDSMAPCVALHAKLIVDGRRMMQFLPPNQTTLISICNYIREYLRAILEANTPADFHQAWLEFFRIPNYIFKLNARGGRAKGYSLVSTPIEKSIQVIMNPVRDPEALEGHAKDKGFKKVSSLCSPMDPE